MDCLSPIQGVEAQTYQPAALLKAAIFHVTNRTVCHFLPGDDFIGQATTAGNRPTTSLPSTPIIRLQHLPRTYGNEVAPNPQSQSMHGQIIVDNPFAVRSDNCPTGYMLAFLGPAQCKKRFALSLSRLCAYVQRTHRTSRLRR